MKLDVVDEINDQTSASPPYRVLTFYNPGIALEFSRPCIHEVELLGIELVVEMRKAEADGLDVVEAAM